MYERSFSLFSACLGEFLERINAGFVNHLVKVVKCCRGTTIGNDNAVRDLFRGLQHLIAASAPRRRCAARGGSLSKKSRGRRADVHPGDQTTFRYRSSRQLSTSSYISLGDVAAQ